MFFRIFLSALILLSISGSSAHAMDNWIGTKEQALAAATNDQRPAYYVPLLEGVALDIAHALLETGIKDERYLLIALYLCYGIAFEIASNGAAQALSEAGYFEHLINLKKKLAPLPFSDIANTARVIVEKISSGVNIDALWSGMWSWGYQAMNRAKRDVASAEIGNNFLPSYMVAEWSVLNQLNKEMIKMLRQNFDPLNKLSPVTDEQLVNLSLWKAELDKLPESSQIFFNPWLNALPVYEDIRQKAYLLNLALLDAKSTIGSIPKELVPIISLLFFKSLVFESVVNRRK